MKDIKMTCWLSLATENNNAIMFILRRRSFLNNVKMQIDNFPSSNKAFIFNGCKAANNPITITASTLGRWNDYNCALTRSGYVCKKPKNGGWTTPQPTVMPQGWVDGSMVPAVVDQLWLSYVPVWPVKSCQMSIKVPKNDFTGKI